MLWSTVGETALAEAFRFALDCKVKHGGYRSVFSARNVCSKWATGRNSDSENNSHRGLRHDGDLKASAATNSVTSPGNPGLPNYDPLLKIGAGNTLCRGKSFLYGQMGFSFKKPPTPFWDYPPPPPPPPKKKKKKSRSPPVVLEIHVVFVVIVLLCLERVGG